MDISSAIRSQNLYRISGSVNNISSNTKALHVDMKNIDTGDGAYLADSFDLDGSASLLGDVPDLRSIIRSVKKDNSFSSFILCTPFAIITSFIIFQLLLHLLYLLLYNLSLLKCHVIYQILPNLYFL